MSNMDKKTIVRKLAGEKKIISKEYSVKELGLFGSYSTDSQTKKSDIDILVEFNIVPGLFRFISLEEHLSKLFGKKVDLVRKKALRPELRKRILSEVIYV